MDLIMKIKKQIMEVMESFYASAHRQARELEMHLPGVAKQLANFGSI